MIVLCFDRRCLLRNSIICTNLHRSHVFDPVLQHLQNKAEERNPDEFYFAMESARTKDGVHIAR